jgi:hypothetical protein
MAKYQWKLDAGPKPKVDPQVFGDIVEKIAAKLGAAKPQDIVEEASNPRSPIHEEFFQWTDKEAAKLYRLDHARHLIGALQIVRVEYSEGQTISDRGFFHVNTGPRTGYVGQERIMNDQDLKKQVLETVRADLENILRKFGAVMALGNYVPRLQAIIDDMRDDADSVLVQATNRRTAAKEKASSDEYTRA